jgi:hypothetical protein
VAKVGVPLRPPTLSPVCIPITNFVKKCLRKIQYLCYRRTVGIWAGSYLIDSNYTNILLFQSRVNIFFSLDYTNLSIVKN